MSDAALTEVVLEARPPKLPRVKAKTRRSRIGLHAFLVLVTLLWVSPILWAIFTAMRPYADTSQYGFVSWPKHFNFDNFTAAWNQAQFPHYFWNSIIVAVPAIFLILLFSSAIAFVVSRLSFRWNIPLLVFFMAANLLPEQIILQPLYRLYLRIPLPTWLSDSGLMYDSYLGLILINVAFQTGFCTFVLSNYMKTIPKSLTEAARVDGAGVARQYFKIILPLSRPALAALATLEFTFIYNNFLWALILINNGSKRPITAALNNLQGEFFTNNNLLAAGALMTAIPTVLVFAALQKHFVNGLTLGANKG
jgi:multiple sugar transport system permease protein